MNAQLVLEVCIAVLVVVCFVGWVVWQIKKKGLREFAIDTILKAEEKFEKGQNSEKMSYVIKSIKATLCATKIGALLSVFITDENIERFIQNIFNSIKKALDYTPNK